MKQPELGGYIANLRKEQGLTQEELVELCNINVRTIQRIEAGDVTPRNYTIKNILQALGSSYENLVNELHEPATTSQEHQVSLKNNKNGLLIGLIGIFYILLSIPVATIDVFAASGDRLLNVIAYIILASIYMVAQGVFYVSLGFSIQTRSHLMKWCVIFFLLLEVISTGFGIYMYQGDSFIDATDIGLVLGFQVLYGISLIILSIPFFYIRKQLLGIFQYLGAICAVAGICHATFILFPIGIVGFLVFEILLVVLMFQYYQSEKS